MNTTLQSKVSATIDELYHDSRNDKLKMIKGAAKGMFRPIQPADFSEVYLSISGDQGEYLRELIVENNLKNIVEFGTSFGISTLFLAQGAMETGGNIITTELIESKARKAIANFKKADVDDLIEVRVGDAMDTMRNHDQPIDLLLLDGWKDLYLPLFKMLEPNFHADTFIYVDNANMADTRAFLETVAQSNKFHFESMFGGSVVLVTIKK